MKPAISFSFHDPNILYFDIFRWEKQVGDSVAVDEVVCEIETDKTSVPVR